MTPTIVWLIIIVTLFAIGFVSVVFMIRSQAKDEEFFDEYRRHFDALLKDPEFTRSQEDRGWLISNSYQMADLLGPYGIGFQPIRGKLSIPINVVPELCHDYHQNSTTPLLDAESCKAVLTCLGQFGGVLNQRHQELESMLKNPLRWFSEGVRTVISTPLYLLSSFGILKKGASRKASRSRAMDFISGLAALITIATAVFQTLVHLGIL